jgi:16S rRNA (cytidine1402-2'-O)-methyltransferase
MPLVVCPTPIGNLEDVTLRTLRELGEADLVLCEDTRRTRILLDRHGVRARLMSFHRHNEAQRTEQLLPRLEGGERIALASDAGLPGVNDPGARLVAAALERGVEVTVLPGPSAVETALVASGLVGERYTFLGYLPRGRAGLAGLWQEVRAWGWPLVAFESPRRLPASLASLAEADPDRPVAVCRELTKRFEEVARGTAREVADRFRDAPKGEVTVVIGAAPGREPAESGGALEAEAAEAVGELAAAGVPRRDAARVVARLTGIPRNKLYRGSL